jgi:hypothetical protein
VVARLVSKWPQSLRPPDHASLLSALAQMLRKNKRWVCMSMYRGHPCVLQWLLKLMEGGNLNVIHNFWFVSELTHSLIVYVLSTVLIIEWVFVCPGWCVWGGRWCVSMHWLSTPPLSLPLPPSLFLLLAISRVPRPLLLTRQLLLAFPLSLATTLPMESGRNYGRKFGTRLWSKILTG